MDEELLLADDHLVIRFPYDPARVEQIKLITGSKWDKIAKVWRVPMESINLARDFAARHNFHIDTEVLRFDLPEPDNPAFGVMLENEWIFLSFGYDPVKVRAVKQIPAITWHSKSKAWRAPVTSIREVCQWADTFREAIPNDLKQLADEIRERHDIAVTQSRSTDAELGVANLPLLPYQKAGIRYAAKMRRCFIADDMGLGKTIQAIGTLEYCDTQEEPSYPALVVCPPNLVLNWQKEYAKWLPERKTVVVTGRKDFPTEQYDVMIVGYSNIQAWQKQLEGHQACIFDESHYVKTPTAKRTKAAIKIARTVPKYGIVLCLTGTPVTNRPAEYASQLDVLGRLNTFGGLWGFYRRYCGAFQDKFGQWNINGHSNLDELNERLRGNCYIRRTKTQVLTDLPPVRHAPIFVSGTPAAMKEYAAAEQDIVEYLVERAKEIALELGKSPGSAAVVAKIKAEANQHLVRLSVLRRLSARAKMEAVNEWVTTQTESGNKVVIAAHHRDIVDELATRFGGLKIQGGMTVDLVEEHKSRFQEEPCEAAPAMVLSIQAAKTGHTLTAAQDVLFVELPWTPADVDQTYSRCHRLGQKGSVTVTYFLCEGTIDEQMYNLINTKRDVVNVAVDGGSGGSDESVVGALLGLFAMRGITDSV